jgi:glycosyltransferase involved in cell wall biosynthesis
MEPLVSVVVPVFNGMPYLPDLVESLLRQTHEDFEIIFSEGGGTDGSLDYLSGLADPRIRIIHLEEGNGAAANWTAVSSAATGEFTKLICQDDLLAPTALEHQLADLQAHPSAVMAIAQRDIIDAHGKCLYAKRGLAGLSPGLLKGDAIIKECFLRGTNVLGEPLAVLFRTSALREALPWQDENPLMLDLSMYSKVAPQGDVIARMESVGAFRVSSSSWSTKLARLQLEQTKTWQETYAESSTLPISAMERKRAAIGRVTQVNLRRAAYMVLKARGSLS